MLPPWMHVMRIFINFTTNVLHSYHELCEEISSHYLALTTVLWTSHATETHLTFTVPFN